MSISSKIREQIIQTFRAELLEHVQTLNHGLLRIEQNKVAGPEREEVLADLFRAAHSLKGSARAIGVSAVEQLAHALEDILGLMRLHSVNLSSELFTACYQAADAIQTTQNAYEAGELAPPVQALLALAELSKFRNPPKTGSNAKAVPNPLLAPPPPARRPASVPSEPEPYPTAERPDNSREQKAPAPDSSSFASKPEEKALKPAPDYGPPPRTAEAAVARPPSATPSAPEPPPPPGKGATEETVRVSVSKLDALMSQLSELLSAKIRAEQRLAQMRRDQDYLSDWQKDWMTERRIHTRLTRHGAAKGGGAGPVPFLADFQRLLKYVDSSQHRLREMNLRISQLVREFSSDVMQISLIIDRLEEEIKRVRMLPLSNSTGSLHRMVRDLALNSGKEVELEIRGSELELDKLILEQVKDPIIHLLRNAVDHGIEPAAQRRAAGKPAVGKIVLSAAHQGSDIAISVSDDGAGLNIEALRQAAVRRGLPNAGGLTDFELAELIYHSGFSTSPIITDLSGRGVGLDVVRRNIEYLHGRISVEWKPRCGTCFTLTVPSSLTSSRGLMVWVSGQLFAIPLHSIERIKLIAAEEIETVGGSDTLPYNGRPLPLAHLSDVLQLPRLESAQGKKMLPVVILAAAERLVAFAVDDLAYEQEIVIKGLGRQLTRVAGIAGASVLGNGEVVLILHAADLVKLTSRGAHGSVLGPRAAGELPPGRVSSKKYILVVDDSITTRTLEKSILEGAGYRVQVAMDGLEAWNAVRSGELPDLIVSDVAMPNLDGFGLTQRVKTEERTSNIPVILVTSLDSQEDKARGIECGADAYILKGRFDQNNLLETIEQLI